MDEIKNLTFFSQDERLALLRWGGRLPETLQLRRIEQARAVYFKLKSANPKVEKVVLEYCALLLATRALKELPALTRRKLRPGDEGLLSELHAQRLQETLGRKKTTRGRGKHYLFVKANFETIDALHHEGLSWRDIARYIARHHKKKISPSQIFRCFKEIAAQKEKLLKEKLLDNIP